MKKSIALIFIALASVLTLSAQIKVSAPGVVAIDEQFNITFTLTEKPSDFEWSPGENFQLVWGPQTGSSTSISIINGKTSRSSQYTYTYVLMPRVTGTYSLPAFCATLDGNQVYSKTPQIEVVGNGASQQQSSAQQQTQNYNQSQSAPAAAMPQGQEPQQSQSTPSSDLFMRFSLSKTSAVVGEPITATLKLFTRGSIAGFEDAKFPTFNGFWAQEVEAPQSIEFHRESVGDKIYNTAVLRKWVIIPQKSGTIAIDPAELVCLVQQRVSVGGNSIFDGFFDDYQTLRKRVVSTSYKVNVSALPAGAPASFTGAVGSYKISAKLGKDSLKVHDAASLTVTVSGKGNVALVGAPKVNFPPDSEVYDTKTSDRLDKGSGGTSGSKVFEYPFIPRSHGDFTIEPIEFTYYDISSRKYVTLRTQAMDYHVEQGTATDSYVSPDGVSIPVSNRKDVKNLSEDIHYINTKLPSLSSENTFFVGTGLFVALIFIIILLSAAIGVMVALFRKERSNVALVRTRGASKAARKRLSMANGYLNKNLYSAFYEELHKALLGYAADKLNINMADLSKEGIAAAFTTAGAPETLISEYTALLDECEFARYSPQGGNAAMKESYDKAAELISTLDENMKKGKSHFGIAAVTALLFVPALMTMNATTLKAQPGEYVDSLWNQGVSAYANADYAGAYSAFTSIEALGLTSPELYTNIANASYKQRDLASAVLYYERALKLDPSYKDAKYNLEIARQMVQDRIDSVPEFFMKTWSHNICYSLPSNVWTVLFFVFLALCCVMVLVFFLSRRGVWRRIGFFSAIVAFLLMMPCVVNASWQKSDFERRDTAIVFKSVCSAKSAPSGTTDLFVIHEGTKVKVLDTVGDWAKISLSDGREGWVLTSSITII